MAETLVSPGVLATEIDTSFVSSRPVQAGAAIIGPTVKGPVNIPTLVTSWSDYQNKFGTTLVSGGAVYSYFTSIAAYNYFSNGGTSLLISRVVSGTYSPAASNVTNGENPIYTAGKFATASFAFTASNDGLSFSLNPEVRFTGSLNGTTYTYRFLPTQSGNPSDETTGTTQVYFYASGSGITASLNNLINKINVANIGITASNPVSTGDLVISSSASGSTYNGFIFVTGSGTLFSTQATVGGGVDGTTSGGTGIAFTLKTIAEGAAQNSSGSLDANGILPSGSTDNIRWQISTVNTSSGTFNLIIRQGNDSTLNQVVLEQWNNLSLDPFASNYIAKVIGDQIQTLKTDDGYYLQTTGSYVGGSRYVIVSNVTNTPNYLNSNGTITNSSYTASLPVVGAGAFSGGQGDIMAGANFYQNINDTNTQGVPVANYNNMINLLANKDDYQYNIIMTPGLCNNLSGHTSVINSIITNCQDRGDSIYITDMVSYGQTTSTVVSNAQTKNTSYAAAYWPWVQVQDPNSGQNVWVPASTVMGGVYAYNDSVSEPWFAPAGINRGGLSTVIQAERKLPQATRDTLYEGKVNPIATFPGTGVVVYGQKTLQTRASALDRVNVRRLLIALKSYISQVANTLVFEQNSTATRNNFLAQVNPYLENVQQRQGLYAFKVIMDDSNNTADVIDRNELVGQIYVQPTKTAEFIYLDFIVTPTGASFPA
jgi:phage tail sheath protein FI